MILMLMLGVGCGLMVVVAQGNRTALMVAAEKNTTRDVAAVLVEAGADLEAKDTVCAVGDGGIYVAKGV